MIPAGFDTHERSAASGQARETRGRLGPPPGSDLAGLRWLGVWLPVVCLAVPVGLVGIIAATPDVGWPGRVAAYLLVMGIVTVGAYLFSDSIFGIVRQKEEAILSRNRDLAAMNEVGSVVNRSLDIDEVLTRTLDIVLEVTGAAGAAIFAREEGTGELKLRASRSLSAEAPLRAPAPASEGRPHQRSTSAVSRDTEEPASLGALVGDERFAHYVGLPLESRGEVVGVMGVLPRDPGPLAPEDVDLLDALGSQVAVAIENARLDAQLAAMSVVQERQRIAREMHDGLCQQLGYLHLKVGELETNPSLAAVQADLGLMKKVVARAYEEVRQAIFGLKMLSQGTKLVPTLAEYLKEFGEQTGIPVELTVGDEEAIRFPLGVEAQLTRIVQEALSNVRKHARAGHAWVTLEGDGAGTSLTIRDDGCGFDPREEAPGGRPSFGLQTMRERAEAAGGQLMVESERGAGTRVTVLLPPAMEESSKWTS